jgi:hypothetical protein
MFDSKVKFTYGMRCLEKGREGANVFCGIKNLPPRIMQFDKVDLYILGVLKEVCKEKIKFALQENINVRREEEEVGIPKGLSVSVDGTWMKRWNTSIFEFHEYKCRYMESIRHSDNV